MTEAVFAGSMPSIYDRCLGNGRFRPFAVDLVSRVPAGAARILEVAAGTGVVTAELVRALPDAAIVASDLNPPMLDFAASKVTSPRVRFQRADAQSLPFGDADFDALLCQFGVMFVPDKPAMYAEMHRVLEPGGRLLFNVWERLEANQVPMIIAESVAAAFPDDPPNFSTRIPHGYHDAAVIEPALRAAGFTDVNFETVRLTSRHESAYEAAFGACQGTPIRGEIEERDPARLDEVTDATAAAITARFGAGPVISELTAIVVTAIS